MFGKQIKLFKLLGFEVRADWSWIIIAILVTWSLSRGYFPLHYPSLTARAYLLMGIAGALGLFLSIVIHEFCHSVVARGYGLPMKGITLFLFGGVAEMGDEPESAKVEFMMAFVGPVSSVALGLICYGLYATGTNNVWPQPITGVLAYLAVINWMLAGFNLLPAFPLDGGRVLRSILWAAKKNLRWATRVSSTIGTGFGFALMALGILQLLTGNFINAMWWFLIGLFLRNAAGMSYQQLMVRKALEGEKVSRFMNSQPVTVKPSVTIEELVNDYVYKYDYKMFPIVEAGRLAGCITTKEVRAVPRDEWRERRVIDVASECSPANTIQPDDDATKALALMSQNGLSRLIVVKDNHVKGVITLKDMLKFLSLKVELGG
jgi:Zn-dependent protease/CBS domain-containing protein